MKKRRYQSNSGNRGSSLRGFTLLEVVIALGLLGMLVGTIFGVARTSLQLSHMVVDEQNATMERSAFFNLLSRHFEKIPGNAQLGLETADSRGGGVARSMFSLILQNVPMTFNWGEAPITAEAIELATVEQRDGFIDVVLRFYDWKPLDDPLAEGDPLEITLIEDLWMCDCEVVDGNTMEQLSRWDNLGKLPLQVKFYCRFEPTSDIVQQTFWIVPKQNPEVLLRQIIQQNPANQADLPGHSVQPGRDEEPKQNPGAVSGEEPVKPSAEKGVNQ